MSSRIGTSKDRSYKKPCCPTSVGTPIGVCYTEVTKSGVDILWVKLSNSAESKQMVFEYAVLPVNEAMFWGDSQCKA